MSRLSRRLPIILFLLLLVLPTLELIVIFQVGNLIGIWPTLGLLVAESLLGAWIVKREGRRSWQALKAVLNSHGAPSGELADAALVLVGGTLLLTPGFITDAFGFFCVLPFTRPIARRVLTRMVEQRLIGAVTVVTPSASGFSSYTPGGPTMGGNNSGPNRRPQDPSVIDPSVISGEIVDNPTTPNPNNPKP